MKFASDDAALHVSHAYLTTNLFHMRTPHVHAGLEFNYVSCGEPKYRVGAKEFLLRKHDLFIFDSSIPHLKLDSDNSPEFLLGMELEITARKTGEHGNSLGLILSSCPLLRRTLSSVSDGVVLHDMESVGPVIQMVLDAYTGLHERLLLDALATQTLFAIEHALIPLPAPTKGDQMRKRYVELVKLYIHKHYATIWSVSEVTDYLSLNEIYVERIFHQVTHTSIWQYLIATKLKAAADLLVNTKDSNRNIEQKAGFHSRQSFIHSFRKAYGMTPSEYRALHRKQ